MKLKHALFTGVLSTIAAAILLTLVLPATVDAGPPEYSWVACNSSNSCCKAFIGTRSYARGICDRGFDEVGLGFCTGETVGNVYKGYGAEGRSICH